MSQSKVTFLLCVLLGGYLVAYSSSPAAQSSPLPADPVGMLVGTIRSPDGQPMEGVAVSAKEVGRTITTTVYTNQAGQYDFPKLRDGRYRMWAQAIGFEVERANQTIANGQKVTQNFTLSAHPEPLTQLSDIEWFESLPGATPADERMKRIMQFNCGTCHNSSFVFHKRFDRAGWEIIVNRMLKLALSDDPGGARGDLGQAQATVEVPGGANWPAYMVHNQTGERMGPDYRVMRTFPGDGTWPTRMVDSENGTPLGPGRRVMEAYKEEIIDWLVRVRGPESPPIQPKPLPRFTGESTNIVVTEYDLPAGPRNFGILNPDTGHIINYRPDKDRLDSDPDPVYPDWEHRDGSVWSQGVMPKDNQPGAHDVIVDPNSDRVFFGSQGIVVDKEGVFWFGNRGVMRFDPDTGDFKNWPHSEGRYNAGKDYDLAGNLWMPYFDGAWRFNPKTGQYTQFPAVSRLGRSYGLSVDGEGNVYFAQIASDRIGVVDAKTGKTAEVILPPLYYEYLTDKDMEIGPGWTGTHPIWGRGPRRIGADKFGHVAWASQFFAGRLAKIDGRTREYTDYPLPGPYRFAYPYMPVTDKNHRVWFSMVNADAVGSFDPVSEKFTFYPLPTRGHNGRHLDVNTSLDVPEVWIPYMGQPKVARLQFRTAPAR